MLVHCSSLTFWKADVKSNIISLSVDHYLLNMHQSNILLNVRYLMKSNNKITFVFCNCCNTVYMLNLELHCTYYMLVYMYKNCMYITPLLIKVIVKNLNTHTHFNFNILLVVVGLYCSKVNREREL